MSSGSLETQAHSPTPDTLTWICISARCLGFVRTNVGDTALDHRALLQARPTPNPLKCHPSRQSSPQEPFGLMRENGLALRPPTLQ